MIDPNKPLELSNGTPVRLISIEDGAFYVEIPARKPYKVCDPVLETAITFYYDSAGQLMGFEDDINYCTLRNKEPEE